MVLLISRVVALVIGGIYGGPEFALGLFEFYRNFILALEQCIFTEPSGIDKRESVVIY